MIGNIMLMVIIAISIDARDMRIPARRSTEHNASCYAYLELEKTACYAGEPIPFQCHMYGPCDNVQNACLAWSDQEQHMYVYPQPHVSESDNKRVWTWLGVWYPHEPGSQRFPQLEVSYDYERRRKGRSGMFGSLWGGYLRERTHLPVRGSGSRIDVWNLPDHAVDAVGAFGICEWDHMPASLEVGRTYELHLRVSGAGNFPYIQAPSLREQEGLRWFYVGERMEHPVHAYQKTFVYAIYVTQPGTYTIDVSGWRVFNPTSHSTYTCHPGAYTMRAYGQAMSSEVQETDLPDTSSEQHADASSHEDNDDIPYLRYCVIPFRWFAYTLAIPFLISSGWLGYMGVCAYRSCHREWFTVKRAFRRVRRQMRHVEDPYYAYREFMYVFTSLAMYTHVTHDVVEQHIQRYLPEHIDAWRTFWNDLIERAFDQNTGVVDETMRRSARTWVDRLYCAWKTSYKSHCGRQ